MKKLFVVRLNKVRAKHCREEKFYKKEYLF